MSDEKQTIRTLSDRIVAAQKPIRILDAIKWDDSIKADFFKNDCQQLPKVDKDYYKKIPLNFDTQEKVAEFREIIRDIKNLLGPYSSISSIMVRRCEEYCTAVEMLAARGTALFSQLAMELYGSPDEVFYPGGPKVSELGSLLGGILETLSQDIYSEADEKRHTPEQAQTLLQARYKNYFTHHEQVMVTLSDNIVADAAAGADNIKLNRNVMFSDRDLRYLEVHEGWVHVGTTLNGSLQPYCTFLAKGSPSSSVTQEGLAVLTEVVTFSSNPIRMLRITNRVRALNLVHQGANFLDIYRYFLQQGRTPDESYYHSMRIFRGSTPTGQPFTKDLSYTKGFILIYNYIRLAVQKGLVRHLPIFFVGKTTLDEIRTLADLVEQGLVTMPLYIPPQFKDLAALSSWMSFSLFLNKFDLEQVAKHYRLILSD